MSDATTLLENLNLATMEDGRYGLMADAVIAISNGQISWAGARTALPVAYAKWQRRDLGGRLATPALIDCHTHIVHGGNRANEFEMRLQGATYEDVARAGGGIISTVAATRKATVVELVASALPRIDALMAEGVAVIEIKSGYGLDVESECNMLRAARQIASQRKVKIVTTFLGAHAIPAEFKGRADEYIDNVCIPALKVAHAQGLVDAVDGFCEGIAFSTDQIRRVFSAAKAMGLPVKLHAEQLSNLRGAILAAEFGAMSAEHLEYVDEPGVKAMAEAGSVAVILPGAFYTLRETQKPPIDLFRKHNVPMAVATDMNPGSSPMTSLLLAMNMACTLFRLTPEEALAGTTVHAARALRLEGHGVIAAGSAANIAVWNVKHPAELSYRIGFNPLYERFVGSSI